MCCVCFVWITLMPCRNATFLLFSDQVFLQFFSEELSFKHVVLVSRNDSFSCKSVERFKGTSAHFHAWKAQHQLCLGYFCFSCVSFFSSQDPASIIPSLPWLGSPHMPEPLLPTTEQPKSYKPQRTHYANVWHCDVDWCHKVTELKARLPTRRFRGSVFCGREEIWLVWSLTFLTFKFFHLHKNVH